MSQTAKPKVQEPGFIARAIDRIFTQLARWIDIAFNKLMRWYWRNLLATLALSGEVFTRTRFGGRYITVSEIFKTIVSAMITIAFVFLYLFITEATTRTWQTYFYWYDQAQLIWLILLTTALITQKSITWWLGNIKKQPVEYTRSWGEAYPFWFKLGFKESELFRCIEPLSIFLIGSIVLVVINRVLGVLLLITGIAVLIKRQKQHYERRDAILNVTDGRYFSRMISNAITREETSEEENDFVIESDNLICPPELRGNFQLPENPNNKPDDSNV
jgi:hypothetical protein